MARCRRNPLRKATSEAGVAFGPSGTGLWPVRWCVPMTTAWVEANRLGGLRRFAIAISVLYILGHTGLGFEQPWITPFFSLAASYCTEILLKAVDARQTGRRPRFLGRAPQVIDFLLSAHISGLAVGMLLYAN